MISRIAILLLLVCAGLAPTIFAQTTTGFNTGEAPSTYHHRSRVSDSRDGGHALAATNEQIVSLSGLQVIDGYQTTDDDIIILVDQADARTNGLWRTHSGAWTRPSWYSKSYRTSRYQIAPGLETYIERGDTWADCYARLAMPEPVPGDASIIVDTTPTLWKIGRKIRTSVADTDCIALSQTVLGEISAEPILAAAPDNQLQCIPGKGLYVPSPAISGILDTPCIDLAIDPTGVLSASPILSSVVGNSALCIADGLYVPEAYIRGIVDTDCIDLEVTAGGLSASPIIVADPANQLQCIPGKGLFVPAPPTITVLDTACLDLTLTAAGVLSGEPVISGQTGNAIKCLKDGLYVPEPTPLNPTDTNCIDLSYDAGSGKFAADPILDPALENKLECTVDGLKVSLSPTSITRGALLSQRNAGTLIPGCWYRITNADATPAGDVIVLATAADEVSESGHFVSPTLNPREPWPATYNLSAGTIEELYDPERENSVRPEWAVNTFPWGNASVSEVTVDHGILSYSGGALFRATLSTNGRLAMNGGNIRYVTVSDNAYLTLTGYTGSAYYLTADSSARLTFSGSGSLRQISGTSAGIITATNANNLTLRNTTAASRGYILLNGASGTKDSLNVDSYGYLIGTNSTGYWTAVTASEYGYLSATNSARSFRWCHFGSLSRLYDNGNSGYWYRSTLRDLAIAYTRNSSTLYDGVNLASRAYLFGDNGRGRVQYLDAAGLSYTYINNAGFTGRLSQVENSSGGYLRAQTFSGTLQRAHVHSGGRITVTGGGTRSNIEVGVANNITNPVNNTRY